MAKKAIPYEKYDEGVTAAYKLGVMDGRDESRVELEELRGQAMRLLTTNKELFEEVRHRHIYIKKTLAKRLVFSLRKAGDLEAACVLKKKYKEATGIALKVPNRKLGRPRKK